MNPLRGATASSVVGQPAESHLAAQELLSCVAPVTRAPYIGERATSLDGGRLRSPPNTRQRRRHLRRLGIWTSKTATGEQRPNAFTFLSIAGRLVHSCKLAARDLARSPAHFHSIRVRSRSRKAWADRLLRATSGLGSRCPRQMARSLLAGVRPNCPQPRGGTHIETSPDRNRRITSSLDRPPR